MLAQAPFFLPSSAKHSFQFQRPCAMSSPGVDRHSSDKPPAAITGSPGTAIFSPPAQQSTRPVLYSNNSSSTHLVRAPLSTPRAHSDPIPVQWSFESNYGLFGPSGANAIVSSSSTPRKEPKSSGMLSGMWFGRRKDRNAAKPAKSKSDDRSRTVEASVKKDAHSALPSQLLTATQVSPLPTAKASATSLTSPATTGQPSTHSLLHPGLSSSHDISTTLPEPSGEATVESIPPAHLKSQAPLYTIPASNAPTPLPSRAPSPSISGSRPPPSFRHISIATRRPGSSSGIANSLQHAVHVPNTRSRRRPATSEGVSSSNGSRASLVSSVASSAAGPMLHASPLGPSSREEIRASMEAVKRRRTEAWELGFKMKNGKRHHPRSKEEAPYPRDYERKTTD